MRYPGAIALVVGLLLPPWLPTLPSVSSAGLWNSAPEIAWLAIRVLTISADKDMCLVNFTFVYFL